MTSKETFNGFVTKYRNIYRRSRSNGQSFMSLQTFIDWFFAWSSRMKTEFRESCHWCDSVNVLACDATKIGIGFKHTFVKPIESPEIDEVAVTPNKRLDRCFISNHRNLNASLYNDARKHLKQICTDILSKSDCEELILDEVVLQLNKSLHDSYIPTDCRNAFKFLTRREATPIDLRHAYANVFKLLSYDSCLDAMMPYKCVQECIQFIEQFNSVPVTHQLVTNFCRFLRQFCPELSHLLGFSFTFNNSTPLDVISLIKYIAKFVSDIHQNDVIPDEADPIENTYNPAKFGRAYYFHPHGCQLRKMRPFTADKNAANRNFDDRPASICNKSFPQVSKKGVSYLFLWFCPIHGHCYGFHIIPGSEGRKDPAASLYTHLKEAPGDILYDFACSLSEYAHNRESGYFKNTSYFHDVFHGYTHKCSAAFRCNRLSKFNAVNSSICEQFNSFLQNVKTSAKLMSQTHFCFYLQFFIHVWNQQKRESFEKRLNIAMNSKV